jgi:hypothetical protein
MRFRTNSLTGTITGSGRVNLLSGRIRLNGSGLDPLRGAHPRVHWAAVTAGWAAQATRARWGRPGRAVDSAQTSNSIKKLFFFFKYVL